VPEHRIRCRALTPLSTSPAKGRSALAREDERQLCPDARAGIAARETEYTPTPEGRTVNTCHGRHTTDRAARGA
jgi:hypothetical protein